MKQKNLLLVASMAHTDWFEVRYRRVLSIGRTMLDSTQFFLVG
jgi:hypothetical protein